MNSVSGRRRGGAAAPGWTHASIVAFHSARRFRAGRIERVNVGGLLGCVKDFQNYNAAGLRAGGARAASLTL